MRVLYIDTSSSCLYAGISDEEHLICDVKKEFGHSLSEEALPEIAKLLTENKILPTDIDKILVVNGPGSFTGIRIGITIAKVYAWSHKIPITTISALEAMMLSSNTDKIKVPIINARRGYVFGAAYNQNTQIIEPKHIKFDELCEMLNGKEYIFITNDEFDVELESEKYNPDIFKIINYYKNKTAMNPHAVNPEYLKLTEAEESKIS